MIPTGCPFQCHSGRMIVPGVMKLNIAGITMMPVKIGMNSHTRLTKNPSGSAETIASRTVAAYITTSVGMFRTNAVTISRPRNDRILTRGSSRWRKPRCCGDVVAEHRAAHDADGPREGLLHEAALLPLADAAARAQRELAR